MIFPNCNLKVAKQNNSTIQPNVKYILAMNKWKMPNAGKNALSPE